MSYTQQDTENKHFLLGKIIDICHCLEITVTSKFWSQASSGI